MVDMHSVTVILVWNMRHPSMAKAVKKNRRVLTSFCLTSVSLAILLWGEDDKAAELRVWVSRILVGIVPKIADHSIRLIPWRFNETGPRCFYLQPALKSTFWSYFWPFKSIPLFWDHLIILFWFSSDVIKIVVYFSGTFLAFWNILVSALISSKSTKSWKVNCDLADVLLLSVEPRKRRCRDTSTSDLSRFIHQLLNCFVSRCGLSGSWQVWNIYR